MLKRNSDQSSPVRTGFMIVSIIMTIVYLCLAGYMFVRGDQFINMPAEFTKVFAAILLMYGLFRGWKTYETYFKNDRHAD
jgi:amino acid permease